MSEPFRVQQIDHVELWVPDQREAAAWYRDVLGLEVVREFEHWADGGPLMVAAGDSGTKLALFRGRPADRVPGRTSDFKRVAFRVSGSDFLAFLARLDSLAIEAEGGGRLSATDVFDHGRALSIYFRDPWAHRFEITTYETRVARAGLDRQ